MRARDSGSSRPIYYRQSLFALKCADAKPHQLSSYYRLRVRRLPDRGADADKAGSHAGADGAAPRSREAGRPVTTNDGERRSGALSRTAVPPRRPVARRTRHDGDRRAVAAQDVLHGRRQRRRVQDDRRRRELGADHRRQGAASRRPARSPSPTPIRTSIYLGTGSDDVRSNVSTGRGVYKIDRRRRRRGVRRAVRRRADRRRPHPSDESEHRRGSRRSATRSRTNAERGVFKTTDGGKTWKKVLFVSDSVGATDVELSPANPDVVYAWMSRRRAQAVDDHQRRAEPTGGFYKSTDGGEHFTKITDGLADGAGRQGATSRVTAANPNRIYALVEAKPGGGLYRSDDAGQTWKLMQHAARQLHHASVLLRRRSAPIRRTPTSSTPAPRASTSRPTAARRCTTLRTPHGDNHDIWISPKDGKIMIQSNDGGANVSYDGGRTWSTQMNQPTAEIYGVWLDEQFPYRPVRRAAGREHGDHAEPSRSPGTREPIRRSGPGCETGPIMPHPKNPDIVYGACKGQFGVMFMNTRPGAELLGRRAVALRQRREGSDLPLPARVADGDVAVRSRASSTTARSIVHRSQRRRRALGEDLARPHRASGRAARAAAASRSRATSPAKSSTARSTRSASRSSSRA